MTTPPITWRLDLPFGRCVGVAVVDPPAPEALAALRPEERRHAQSMPAARRPSFVAGRLALRTALADLGLPDGPLLPNERGAPRCPEQTAGSISHKRTRAVGLAAPSDGHVTVGVDLEENRPLRIDIARRVLTATEQADVRALSPAERDRAVLLRFSLKEAVYKALDPIAGPLRLSFQHVQIIRALPHELAEITYALPPDFPPFSLRATWTEVEGHILSAAEVVHA